MLPLHAAGKICGRLGNDKLQGLHSHHFVLPVGRGLISQFETSEVLGTVRDNTGGVVAKTTVMLAQQDTGRESKSTTAATIFLNVKVGRYTVTVEATGFTKFTARDVPGPRRSGIPSRRWSPSLVIRLPIHRASMTSPGNKAQPASM
jgi:hypothetical protein